MRCLIVLTFTAATSAFAQGNSDFTGVEPGAGQAKPAPRLPNGKPDLSGYWKGTRNTKPVGNIGKDLPGFQLPLTAAGKAADEF